MMLELRGLNQYYGGSHTLRGIDLSVPAGTCTALLGRNGVGKTTLLRCLMGLLPVRSGRIAFDGKSHLPVRLVFWGGDRTVLTSAFLDRRSIGGINVPFRISTTAGERSVDELLFDDVAVNPALTKTDFSR